jgi:hypothetical protein
MLQKHWHRGSNMLSICSSAISNPGATPPSEVDWTFVCHDGGDGAKK